MWLLQITLKDFRCFFGEHSIDFSQDPERNVTLIHAENGVGKTTLLNALLWCFYGQTTDRFEKRDDLVNYDAKAAGVQFAFVEVLFEHNGSRYRARRYTRGGGDERAFTIMRIDGGSHIALTNADAFINTVIPKSMAGHFLFDGEHAEVFLGEDNRRLVRKAVQDILGCSLIEIALQDLEATATWYRQQMPKTRASASMESLNARIDSLANQITAAYAAKDRLIGDVEMIEQRIADIDDKLRNSAAAKSLQASRDRTRQELARAKLRESEAQAEVLKWLGDNGRFLVSTKITDLGMDHLDQQETKGRLPSPYNEEFVKELLELKRCICGAELEPGSDAHTAVSSLLHKAANAVLRSRITKVRARLSQLRSERHKAPARLETANKRLYDAREDISRHEQQLDNISESLKGIDFDDIAEREIKRTELRQAANLKRQQLGGFDNQIQMAERDKASAERDLRKLAEEDAGARIFIKRYNLCEELRGQLEVDLKREEEAARSVLRASINRILAATSRKAFNLNMTKDYSISLINHAGTQMPKSSGENQLLGLAFTAALVDFARVRQGASDRRLLKGTIAPLVLDSPFGQLDEEYRRTTASFIPQMAGQVVLMLSQSQASGPVMEALGDRIGEEVVLVRYNRADREGRKAEVRQFHGKDVETALFGAPHDGSAFVRVTR